MKQSTKETCVLELKAMHHRVVELRQEVEKEANHFEMNELLFAISEHLFSVTQVIKYL